VSLVSSHRFVQRAAIRLSAAVSADAPSSLRGLRGSACVGIERDDHELTGPCPAVGARPAITALQVSPGTIDPGNSEREMRTSD
jgi:hypothetical protein